MLQLLDDGQVTDSKGTKVDFKNCIVIFTSNIGSQDIIDLGGTDGDQALMKERVSNAMRANVSGHCFPISKIFVSIYKGPCLTTSSFTAHIWYSSALNFLTGLMKMSSSIASQKTTLEALLSSRPSA